MTEGSLFVSKRQPMPCFCVVNITANKMHQEIIKRRTKNNKKDVM